jgi:hypothetical protein
MPVKKFSFDQTVTTGLHSLGARQSGPYGYQLDTIGGLLDIKPYADWVACRFDDVERANEQIHCGQLNRYSGKWNWHFSKPTAQDVAYFLDQLRCIQLVPRAD